MYRDLEKHTQLYTNYKPLFYSTINFCADREQKQKQSSCKGRVGRYRERVAAEGEQVQRESSSKLLLQRRSRYREKAVVSCNYRGKVDAEREQV